MTLKWFLLLLVVALIASTVITIVYLGWIAFLVFACGDILTFLIGLWWGASGRSGGRPYVIPPECRRSDVP